MKRWEVTPTLTAVTAPYRVSNGSLGGQGDAKVCCAGGTAVSQYQRRVAQRQSFAVAEVLSLGRMEVATNRAGDAGGA